MSQEEFFMYLTIALIVLIPISVRVYRYLTAQRVKQMMREEFRRPPDREAARHESDKDR